MTTTFLYWDVACDQIGLRWQSKLKSNRHLEREKSTELQGLKQKIYAFLLTKDDIIQVAIKNK